jgi:hypothetical protein
VLWEPRAATDLLDEIGQAHGQADENVDLSQDTPRILLGVLDVSASLLQESRGIIELRVGGVLGLRRFCIDVVHCGVVDMLDDILLLLVIDSGRHVACVSRALCVQDVCSGPDDRRTCGVGQLIRGAFIRPYMPFSPDHHLT